jgi:ABC-2 type transport system ATP-binding protein
MTDQPALTIRNLRVDYGDFTAVDNLSVELPAGEIFGLAGPNGAGKTSTIRVLATLLEPTYGEVEIFGYDLFEDTDDVHRLLGYMPDLAPVIPDLKVSEFLDLYASSYGLRGAQKRARIDACLEKVDLADKRHVYGRALSRGMTQRVVLAKTLLHDPRLLLLDEPASGMDPIARRDMRMILEALAADGATVIVSSHILSELSDMCTSVGIMHLGRLLRHGPLSAVLGNFESGSVRVELQVLDGHTVALDMLSSRHDVDGISVEGRTVAFLFRGDESACSVLLRELVEGGIGISAFTPQASGIEAVLMEIVQSDRL